MIKNKTPKLSVLVGRPVQEALDELNRIISGQPANHATIGQGATTSPKPNTIGFQRCNTARGKLKGYHHNRGQSKKQKRLMKEYEAYVLRGGTASFKSFRKLVKGLNPKTKPAPPIFFGFNTCKG